MLVNQARRAFTSNTSRLARASAVRSFATVPLTKIVATIGPVSEDAVTLPKVVEAGMTVMRLNFSHATDEEVSLRIKSIEGSTGCFPLDGPNGMLRAILLDTKGPEIRTGGLQAVHDSGDVKAKITLKKGETITLIHDEAWKECGTAETLYVTYPSLGSTATVGKTILLDDGAVSLAVLEVDATTGAVKCRVENDGSIASRRGVNLPGMKVDLPAMSPKDFEDIRYGIEKDMDFVAASFVRKAEDVHQIRAHISACHAEFWPASHPQARIIAKIESTEALENLDEITEAADGIMVARGDLGVEVPLEEVVIWQKEMVKRCLAAASGKPVVVATQMLESMQKNPRPTRAEVSDVTNAVLDGADAVMLSGESANGQYPVESVDMMTGIIKKTEAWMSPRQNLEQMLAKSDSKQDAVAASCVFTAEKLGAKAIIVKGDETGDLTRLVSKYRPNVPVLALTESLKVARQLSIHRGVYPTLLPYHKALAAATAQGLFKSGDQLIMAEATRDEGNGDGLDMAIIKAA